MDGVSLFNDFVALHKPQLQLSNVPPHLWEAVFSKITTDTFDAGAALSLMLIDYSDSEREETSPVFALCVSKPDGIRANDPNAIYLVDHAWTFRTNIARQQLEEIPQLAERMSAITGVDLEDADRVDKILHAMWKYCQAYSIAAEGTTAEERVPIWYVMDEVGSAVNHSDDPNFRIVPFLHLNTQTTYSLLFPIRDVEEGEQVTRDFVEYVAKDAPERDAVLLPWRYTDLKENSFVQSEPDADYFSNGHVPESLPEGSVDEPVVSRNDPLKVFSEYDVLSEYLTAPYFEIVDNPEDADVLWLINHFKDFAALARDTPNKFVNQFPYEYVLTVKDLLCITCRRGTNGKHHDPDTLDTLPAWLPTTYNLKTEVLQFASYFQNREAKGLDNHWIIKPWNLARSLDTYISNNIAQIMRLPATGPKIAQKYIERPVLFHRPELDARVKFDVRYVILLKSVLPLEAYIHRKFYLRFANKPFSLDHFDEYEKHFTVMNYLDEAELRHIKCDDFLEFWEQQYPNNSWNDVEDSICSMLYEVLHSASSKKAPCGIPPSVQSRALYAADIMLSWQEDGQRDIQPKLLEVNFTPDCKRACEYYPDFYNDIFKLLFLNEHDNEVFRKLTKN
ncbi:tubulin--tyrosine ligase-like protein 12 [Eupeodes corollae]|uniref:tubulin--tyrosine ligase-like protein 12 n=1 Tax=Eupeodes corollae TaxID=290404 RepID=UPI0024932E02|nr:tubulin--tyrosine ligase-like protein 12 [Eupeodes corollae]